MPPYICRPRKPKPRSLPFMIVFTIGAILGALLIYSFAAKVDATDEQQYEFVRQMDIRINASDLAMRKCGACHCQ